jgi:DNA polymerase III delta subunit
MSGIANSAAVHADLEAGRAASVYLLVGDDETGKTPLLHALEGLVEEGLRGFNLHRFRANEPGFDLIDVLAAARTLPFMGGRRLVVLLRAESLLRPKGRSATGGPADVDAVEGEESVTAAGAAEPAEAMAVGLAELDRYLQAPPRETCLVIVSADINRATRIGRSLLKYATVVEFWGLKDEREARGRGLAQALVQAERYVRQRAREARLAIDDEGVERILAHAGADMATLRGDVDRVLTYCAGRSRATGEDVQAVVGGAAAHDDWALLRAIENRDLRQALRLLQLMLDGGSSPYQVLGQLGWWVRAVDRGLPRLAPHLVPAAVRAVFETDLALKTSRGDPQVLLERLVVELCGDARGGRGRPGPPATPRPGWR